MSLMGNQTDVNKRHIFVITGRFLKILLLKVDQNTNFKFHYIFHK